MSQRKKRKRTLNVVAPQLQQTPDLSKTATATTPSVEGAFAFGVEQRIGALESTIHGAIRDKHPWYRTPSVIISFVALLFSFGTTFVSNRRTSQQDIHDARTELRGLVGRLNSIPRETAEIQNKNPQVVATNLVNLLNNEANIIAVQAFEIAHRIPSHVSATECSVVANALVNMQDFSRARQSLTMGMDLKPSLFDEIGLRKQEAAIAFLVDDVDGGRSKYERVLKSIANSAQSENTKAWMISYAESTWATSEFWSNQIDKAIEHSAKALTSAAKLPSSPSNNVALLQSVILLRYWGTNKFSQGDIKNGRRLFQAALLENGQENDPIVLQSNNAITEMNWASLELATKNVVDARVHLTKAKAYAAEFSAFVPNTEQLLQQLNRLDAALGRSP